MRTSMLSLLLLAAACGGDDSTNNNNNGTDAGGSNGSGDDGGGSGGCTRTPAAADRTRFIVVGHPYDANSNASNVYEVVKVEQNGAMSRFAPARTFTLGNRNPFGTIAFTPDGEVGIVPMDNGNLGVFRISPEGDVTVTQPDFNGAFYADRVYMDPSGDRAWVIDRNTRENGGGIYAVSINCDGTLTDGGLVAAAKSPSGLGFDGTRAIVAAREILDSPTTVNDVHILDWSQSAPTVVGGGDAFGDDNQVFSGFALSHDGMTAFIGDSNVVGTNRVAVVSVGATDVTPLTVINITDPSSIVASPFGDVALVSGSQPPEGLYVLDKTGTGNTWRSRGEMTYAGPNSQLPGDIVMLERGTLTGHAFVAELSNLRHVAFQANGTVQDVASLTWGDGIEDILGAVGITP